LRDTSEGGESWLELNAWDLRSRSVPKRLADKARFVAFSMRLVKISVNPPVYVYLGENGDHVLVDSAYCSCDGFLRRISDGLVEGCSHVYAVRLAEETGRVRLAILSPEEVGLVVWEVLTGGLTRTLRRKLLLERRGGD